MPQRAAHDGYIERRNYPTRAETLCRVLDRLLNRRGDPGATLPWIPDEAAERILRRLAYRGMARYVAGVWLPTAVLLHPAQLIPIREQAQRTGTPR